MSLAEPSKSRLQAKPLKARLCFATMAMSDDDSASTLFHSDDESLPASGTSPSPSLASASSRVQFRYKSSVSVDTDKALLQLLLSNDRHAQFFRVCRGKEDLFGWPNTAFRKKVRNRRSVLIKLQKDSPNRFIELCNQLDARGTVVRHLPTTPKLPPTIRVASPNLKRPVPTSVPAKEKTMADYYDDTGKIHVSVRVLGRLSRLTHSP
jgi:hypothetical protein